MVLKALTEIGNCETQVEAMIAAEDFAKAKAAHGHHHGHGRSYQKVKELIASSSFSQKSKETAARIYGYIAEAEAKVHKESLETIHFHEVGRDEAIKNALGIGMALESIAPDQIYTSPICDGKGTVLCSHGEIPVPVPAVMALREKCSYVFRQVDVNMEMVTPSGLASLMGIGAKPFDTDQAWVQKYTVRSRELSEAPARMREPLAVLLNHTKRRVMLQVEAKGSRDTGRPGLKVYLLHAENGFDTDIRKDAGSFADVAGSVNEEETN